MIGKNKMEEGKMRRDIGKGTFDKKVAKLGFIIIGYHNHIVNFTYKEKEYYFAEKTSKVRQKSNSIWYRFASYDFENDVSNVKFNFGKYNGQKIYEVAQKDIQYIEWLLRTYTKSDETERDLNNCIKLYK